MRQQAVSAVMAVGFCFGFAAGAGAQAKGKPSPPPVSVVAAVQDFDGVSNPRLFQSDELGTYADSSDVKNQISGTNGDWELDLSAQTSRTVHLTFAPVSGPSAVADGFYNARVISRCFDTQGNISGLLQIGEGSSNTRCSFRIVFTANGSNYFLVMSPLYAGTGWATVACPLDADANTSCEHWTLDPGTGPNAGVASLYTIGRANKDVFVGSYNLTFHLDLNKP